MEQEHQFEDFLMSVNDEYRDFVTTIHKMVIQDGYDKVTISSSKTNLFSVKYTHPKTRRGIVNFTLKKRGFKISVFAANFAKYPDALNRLPESMENQITKTPSCKNIMEPGTCMGKCIGYDFHINEAHYQKCKFNCFQFNVDAESIPLLLELIERELAARRTAS